MKTAAKIDMIPKTNKNHSICTVYTEISCQFYEFFSFIKKYINFNYKIYNLDESIEKILAILMDQRTTNFGFQASSKNENRRYYQEELLVPVKWIGGSDAIFSTFQQRSDKHALCTESLQNQID